MAEDATRSSDPRLVAARVFIGNLPTEKTNTQEIRDHFIKYGPIMGVSLFKGFGFVQFQEIPDAHRAVQAENRAVFKGQKIDVRLAAEGRKKQTDVKLLDSGPSPSRRINSPPPVIYSRSPPRRPLSPGLHRDPRVDPRSMVVGAIDRHGEPLDPYYYRLEMPTHSFSSALDPAIAAPHSMVPHIGTSVAGGLSSVYAAAGSVQAPLNAVGLREARPTEREMVEDTAAPPPGKRTDIGLERPFDCAILVADKNNRAYAEMVERRLLELNLAVDLLYLMVEPADSLSKIVESFSQRGLLYLIIIQKQHEDHKSVTVNILHGSPQEHRNMPLEDALLMLSRDFNGYLSKLRTGSEQPSLNFLLHLISDGKNLSQGELDRVIQHLQARKDQLAGTSGANGAEQQNQFSSGQTAGNIRVENAEQIAAAPPVSQTSAPSSAADLQKKILSILGGSTAAGAGSQSFTPDKPAPLLGTGPANIPPLTGSQPISASGTMPLVSKAGVMTPAGSGETKISQDLQQTLNSLLQNPDALKNIMPAKQNAEVGLGDSVQQGGNARQSFNVGNGYGGGSYQVMVSARAKSGTPDIGNQQRMNSARYGNTKGLLEASENL